MTSRDTPEVPTPERLDEVYWMLLSVIALEPEEMVRHFHDAVPERDNPRALVGATNPLRLLASSLLRYYNYWFDEFEPNVVAAQRFDLVLAGHCREVTRDVAGIFCREELYGGQAWAELRNLARDVLDEVDLEPHPVPTPIRFDELIEIVGPEDIPLSRRKK